ASGGGQGPPKGQEALAGENEVKLWDPATGKQRASLSGHTGIVHSATFSPDGKTLASASWDGTVRLWDVGTARAVAACRGHTGRILSVAFSPDGKPFASGGDDATVKLWNVPGHQGN